MAEFYLRAATETSAGAKDGDIRLSIEDSAVTFQQYNAGKWSDVTTSMASAPPIVVTYTDYAGFPATGEAGKLYIDLDTSVIYYWDLVGEDFAPIVPAAGP